MSRLLDVINKDIATHRQRIQNSLTNLESLDRRIAIAESAEDAGRLELLRTEKTNGTNKLERFRRQLLDHEKRLEVALAELSITPLEEQERQAAKEAALEVKKAMERAEIKALRKIRKKENSIIKQAERAARAEQSKADKLRIAQATAAREEALRKLSWREVLNFEAAEKEIIRLQAELQQMRTQGATLLAHLTDENNRLTKELSACEVSRDAAEFELLKEYNKEACSRG